MKYNTLEMEKRHVFLLLLPPLCLSLNDLKPPQLLHLNLRVLMLARLQQAGDPYWQHDDHKDQLDCHQLLQST